MKALLEEYDDIIYLKLIPEDLKEVTLVARLAFSAKKVVPEISTVFPFDSIPECRLEFIKKQTYEPWIG